MRNTARWVLTSTAAGLIALISASPASAATQIGETFAPDPGPTGCGGGFTRLQSTSPNGQYAAPFSGVITAWSFQADSTVPQIKLKVARPLGGNDFRIVGESPLKTPAPDTLNTFTDVQIPVEAGDVIGNYTATFGHCADHSAPPGYIPSHWRSGDQAANSEATFNTEGVKLDISAILEPDCDGDGLGDETQDPELPLGAACGKGNRTLTLDANKNKVKERKKVTLSGRLAPTARQGPCESAQTVELQRKRPSQTTFATFASVQTDAQGSFSLKKKVKKTFEYRAQVVETATCTSALSNTEKVKVKKKKRA